MAQVVEVFGAPGTGKSSLVRALDGRRVGSRHVVAVERLLDVGRHSGAVGPAAPLGSGVLRRLGDRASRRARTPQERRALVAARRSDWEGLIGLLRAAPLGRDGDDPLEPLHAPGWMAATFESRALADAASDDLIVVIGEGFAQRVRLMCGADPQDTVVQRYVAALPPADLQVHLVADPELLAGRLRARVRTIDRHVGLDASALVDSVRRDTALLARVAERLAARGDEVLQLDTRTKGSEGCASRVVEQLERSTG